MGSIVVVEAEVVPQARCGLPGAEIVPEIHVFVLDSTPEAFHKYVVQGSALTVHAYTHTSLLDTVEEVGAGELASLVRVVNFGPAKAESRLEG